MIEGHIAMLARFYVSVAVVGLLGCASRPLPEQRALLDTVGIVKKIRCEAREAVIGELLLLLSESENAKTRNIATGVLKARAAWLVRLEAMTPSDRVAVYEGVEHKDPIHVGLYDLIDPESLKLVKKYDDAAMGFSFTFDISEGNKNTFGVDFNKPFFLTGSAGLGFDSTTDFKRANRRNFGYSETFRELVLGIKDGQCIGLQGGLSVAYPITGDINLRESISTFLRLNEHSKLEAKEKAPVFTDQITFNTDLTLSATPTLTLAHAGLGWRAAGANASFTAERKDLHAVTLAISLNDDSVASAGERRAASRGKNIKTAATRNVMDALSKLQDADTLSRAIRRTLQQ
jgi:hypothetical protein